MSLAAFASFCDDGVGRCVSVRQAVAMVREGLKDAALGGGAFDATCSHEASELVPQNGQTPHLRLDLRELRDRHGMGVAAGAIGVGG